MLKLYHTGAESVHGQLKKLIAPHICGSFEILRTQNGKPYIEGNPVYFSLSHSRERAVVAVCDEPVGVDMEVYGRRNFKNILSRFTPRERAEIDGDQGKFLENWTAKEAFVKMKGEGIFSYIKRLEYFGGVLFLDGIPQNCAIYAHRLTYGVVTLCTEKENEKQVEHVFL